MDRSEKPNCTGNCFRKLDTGNEEIAVVETTGTCKVYSVLTVTEDFVIKGITVTEIIQISDTMYILNVAFQDTMNNIVLFKCTNFKP